MRDGVDVHKQSGLSFMLVVFILAAVAVLGLSISVISGTQHFTGTYTYRGSQAYFSARAGVEYALARIASGIACAGVSPSISVNGFTVAVSCSAMGPFDEGVVADSYSIYNITATASRGGFTAPDAATRQVRASIKYP